MDCSHVTRIPAGEVVQEEKCPAPAFGLFLDEPFCYHHLHVLHEERMRPIDIKPLQEPGYGREGLRHWGGPDSGQDEPIGAADDG